MVRQSPTKTADDALIAYLTTTRDAALANARTLLADDAPPVTGYPREIQVERALLAAEAAQRRLGMFAARTDQ